MINDDATRKHTTKHNETQQNTASEMTRIVY